MQNRRFLPQNHPFRTDPRWKQRELMGAPAKRIHARQLRYVSEINAMRAMAGTKQADIDELVSNRGARSIRGLDFHTTTSFETHPLTLHTQLLLSVNTITSASVASESSSHTCLQRASPQIAGETTTEKYSFIRVVDHEDDDAGERVRYQVLGWRLHHSKKTLRAEKDCGTTRSRNTRRD